MNLLDYYPRITEEKIALLSLGISSRNYSHWKSEELVYLPVHSDLKIAVDKNEEKRKKVLLNIVDAFWLLIVKELRELNVSFNVIKLVKEVMYTDIDFQSEINKLGKEALIESVLSKLSIEQKKKIKPLTKDDSFFSLILNIFKKEESSVYKNIGGFVYNLLIQKSAIHLILKKEEDNGIAISFRLLEKNSSVEKINNYQKELNNLYFNNSVISIALGPLLQQIFTDQKWDKHTFYYELFNSNEQKIIEALNDDSCKEIKVTKHNSGDATLNLTFENNLKDEMAKQVRKILGLKEYEKMEVTYRNNSHLVVKNTRKEIIKKQ